ncbi:MAG: hypothetical protein Q8M31_13465 [Beijerinckiaceae bacterium]|nr:hypothetical protein [Beijerinckiaceae bacterium]
MAPQYSTGDGSPGFEQPREGTSPAETVSPSALGPVIAGARARGIADALEMLGEGAILLDFSGAVLHVGPRAKPMLGCALAVTGDHVVALSRKATAPLQNLIQAGLAADAPRALEEDLLCAQEGMRQRVRILRVPAGGDYQLLASVLVLEPPRRVRCTRSRRLIAEGERLAEGGRAS